MKTKLSIIIPCYNGEATLDETLESVFNQDFQDWEAIIVNDGSTDKTEVIAQNWVERDDRFRYYKKTNEGLGKTRNYGITIAKADYILPLDADNVLMPQFTKDAVAILDKNNSIGVVHGDAIFIGEKTGIWQIGAFDMQKMLLDNYIDACAVYRKSLWELVGGYEINLPFDGLEDWDLWLAFGALKVEFYYLRQITFKYRVSKNSMIKRYTQEMKSISRSFVAKKYSDLYQFYYCQYMRENQNITSKLQNKRFVLNAFCKVFLGRELFTAKK